MEDEKIMTAEEVADFLRMSLSAVRAWAREGKLPGKVIGRQWKFKKSDILKWYDEYNGKKETD
ncbi:MAG: Helix-turn-helix domain protein [Pelotomaculum sp. PtaU1.Bin065]|nr:MAG: Helix-turn-helix domain protein [Pelotomaculum sp. PtaU1.Bin065]